MNTTNQNNVGFYPRGADRFSSGQIGAPNATVGGANIGERKSVLSSQETQFLSSDKHLSQKLYLYMLF